MIEFVKSLFKDEHIPDDDNVFMRVIAHYPDERFAHEHDHGDIHLN